MTGDEAAAMVKQSVQMHVAFVDESVLLMYLGAIAAQLALRRRDEFDSPAAAVRDVLERGALDVEDWPAERRRLDLFSKLTRRRVAGVAISFGTRDASRN